MEWFLEDLTEKLAHPESESNRFSGRCVATVRWSFFVHKRFINDSKGRMEYLAGLTAIPRQALKHFPEGTLPDGCQSIVELDKFEHPKEVSITYKIGFLAEFWTTEQVQEFLHK